MIVELIQEVGLWGSLLAGAVAMAIWLVVLGGVFALLDRVTDTEVKSER